MPLLRRIVFYLFVAIFFSVCPFMIMRMLGYNRDPQTHRLIKTGIIYVSSNPPDARVYIDNNKAHEHTPTIIRDLLPGDYKVRLELDGYQTWENTVPIVHQKATALENILLIPQKWSTKILSNFPVDSILVLEDANVLLTWQDKTIKGLYMLRLNKDPDPSANKGEYSLLDPVFPQEFIYSNAQIINFFTVDKSPFFILQVLIADKNKYLWVDVRDKQIHIEDISDLLPQEPARLWWEAGDDKNIFAFYNTGAPHRIDIKAKAIYPDIALKDIPLNKTKPLAPGVIMSIYNDDSDTWLDLTDRKIGLRYKNEEFVQWIYTKGHDIQQAFWTNNGSTILFRDADQVYLIDAIPYGQVRLQRIVNTLKGSSIYYSEKTGKLYFIDPKNHYLSTVSILRHKPMLPKTIADTLRLKEFEP